MLNAPMVKDAVMLDKVIGRIQEALVSGLPWLNAAFGRCQRITKNTPRGRIVVPNVYCGGWNGHGENDYIEVSPDGKIGNFSFFETFDPQEIDSDKWARRTRTPFALVFWFDLRRVYGKAENRNTEFLKAQILRLLNGNSGWTLPQGRITINRCYEQAQNIYRGFSLDEVDNQYLMHPFAGFRFEGILEYDEYCFL